MACSWHWNPYMGLASFEKFRKSREINKESWMNARGCSGFVNKFQSNLWIDFRSTSPLFRATFAPWSPKELCEKWKSEEKFDSVFVENWKCWDVLSGAFKFIAKLFLCEKFQVLKKSVKCKVFGREQSKFGSTQCDNCFESIFWLICLSLEQKGVFSAEALHNFFT